MPPAGAAQKTISMQPVDFPGRNIVFAEDQPEYLPLPAFIDQQQGIVLTVWKPTFWERLKILFSARLYLQIITYNKPLQPVFLSTENPLILEK